MKSLSLTRPHAIFIIGLPGSGKSFFAQKFAETFNAPYVDSRSIALHCSTPKDADHIALTFLAELAKTKQTFLFEGMIDSKAKRAEFARWARKHGYRPLLLWVQTDTQTALKRSLHKYKMSREEYDALAAQFSAPSPDEQPIVLSGKHTYATQARAVLSRLTQTDERNKPTVNPAPRQTPPDTPARKSIAIR